MDFECIQTNTGMELTAYYGNGLIVTIPDKIEGTPITSIGTYAMEGHNEVTELVLPAALDTIKAHAFYNCRNLEKISLSDRVTEIEDGAFKNCRSLRFLHMQVIQGKMTCLKNLLSELNQELHIKMDYIEGGQVKKESKLVFPKYAYDYVDNVEARIINQITYGSGVHYRECMKEKDIDFRKYDHVFSVAVVNDTFETLFTIARYRLEYPYQLQEEAKNIYENYIQEHFYEIAEYCIKEEDTDGLLFLGDYHFLTKETIEEVIQTAHRMEKVECVSILLNYKKEHFKQEKRQFEL